MVDRRRAPPAQDASAAIGAAGVAALPTAGAAGAVAVEAAGLAAARAAAAGGAGAGADATGLTAPHRFRAHVDVGMMSVKSGCGCGRRCCFVRPGYCLELDVLSKSRT